jgi:transposase-like protein
MRNQSGAMSDDAVQTATAPAACPACGANDVTTTSKTVSAETYWRCVSCGEVWNVARRDPRAARGPATSSYGYGGRTRQQGGFR